MTRTVSSTITSAVGKDVTQPVYLVYMAWDAASPDVNRYVATWDVDVSWNGITWQGSGVDVQRLNATGGQIRLPNGDGDPWLNLVSTQGPRGRVINIYEHHTDTAASPQTDATLLFAGLMDSWSVTDGEIAIDIIEGLTNKAFPVSSIDPTVYTNLLTPGTRMYWGPDIVLVR